MALTDTGHKEEGKEKSVLLDADGEGDPGMPKRPSSPGPSVESEQEAAPAPKEAPEVQKTWEEGGRSKGALLEALERSGAFKGGQAHDDGMAYGGR